MRTRPLLLALLLASLPATGLGDIGLISPGGVSGGTPYTEKVASYSLVPGGGIRMHLNQRLAAFGLNMNGANWSAYTHLSLTLTNNNSRPTMVEVVIDSGPPGWAWASFIIGANKTENVLIPLQSPQLGGWSTAPTSSADQRGTWMMGSVQKNKIWKVRVWNTMRDDTQDLTLSNLSAVTLSVPTTNIVDQYGQQTFAFPGKITSDLQMVTAAATETQLPGSFPYSNDPYGGVAGTATTAGTGKWRTAKQNNRWYIITPSGNRFFSTGIDCVGVGSLAYVQGRDSLFSPGALPAVGSPLSQMYANVTNPFTGGTDRAFNFYTANLYRKYGSNWQTTFDDVLIKRMRTWGFNTVGPASFSPLYETTAQMANMQHVDIKGNFWRVPFPGVSFPMPDPYDPAWTTAVSTTLTPLVAKLNTNSYNAGLFIDNELPWARPSQEANYRYDLAFTVLSSPSNQPAKQRFYKTLSLKYRTIQKLNTAWGTSFSSWNALLSNQNFRPTSPNANMVRDMQEFMNAFATQYFSTIKTKLVNLNYKGLYLGCRFACYTPEVVQTAARFCDVVSFNCYDLMPSHWKADMKTLDAPVMISEYAFSASDQGRVGGFSPSALTEDGRVEAFQTYVEDAKTWPNLVGMHWYKWEDDPATGRLWDNANLMFGLVSITDTPYEGLVDAATAANTQLNNRLLTP